MDVTHKASASAFLFKLYSDGCSPVQFRSLHQSVCVSITDERSAVQTCEAFWVIFLFPCDLLKNTHTCKHINEHVNRVVESDVK